MASTVTADLIYFSPPPDGSRPYTSINADATGNNKNWLPEHHDVQIENIRGQEDSVTLDNAGFQFFKGAPSYAIDFTDDASVKDMYYPESIELVKKLTGATRIVPFDHTIRRRRPGERDDSPDKRQPVPQVHVDQTPQSAVARVQRHLPPADVPALLARRFQIINLWRPLAHPAFDWPLALCDWRSVDRARDVVPVALLYPDREGETYGVRDAPEHRWKYVRGMRPDEFVLIKCFDSQDDGKTAVFTPHTAFNDPTAPKDAPFRQSIELRLLVFYD